MEARKFQFEAVVGDDGKVLLPNVKPGDRVEIIVLPMAYAESKIQPGTFGGWAAGKVRILPGFNDPIEGMEDYR